MAAISVLNTGSEQRNHTPLEWAKATASHIIEISADAETTTMMEARKFEAVLIDLLTGHHDAVQNGEQGAIASNPDHFGTAVEDGPHADLVETAVQDICAAARGFSFAAHFAADETMRALRATLGSHFNTSAKIERMLHADANPDNAAAVAYKEMVTTPAPLMQAPPAVEQPPAAEPAPESQPIEAAPPAPSSTEGSVV